MTDAKLKCACCEGPSVDFLCDDCEAAGCCMVAGAKCGVAELPDFTTAPAWLDCHGDVWPWLDIATQADQFGPEWASGGAPWTPLRTAEEWPKRIDRDELHKVICQAVYVYGPMGDAAVTDAVIAALPELMGGEQV